MQNLRFDLTPFETVALKRPELNWYAIADSAQHCSLPEALLNTRQKVGCLFSQSPKSAIASYSPHLVSLDPPAQGSRAWQWIAANAALKPCISIITAEIPFLDLYADCVTRTEVTLPDGAEMFLAFWDPAILGTLFGQEDDLTLHVRGPVFTPPQMAVFMKGLAQWWYWDRSGTLHEIRASDEFCEKLSRTELTQTQVDSLVEASVPDHILYFLRRNQAVLLNTVPIGRQYEFIKEALIKAYNLDLHTMQDIVNYVCVELYFKNNIDGEGIISYISDELKNKKIGLTKILRELS